ncbi:hypothetical protein [Erwinia amylovora]|uniref:hypothetical protein n=1 Tax=Erwinia amylovora TaxID=552 RepID=UPI001F04A553|nr:hypothetical protein [Erwinia amylovora]
MYYAKTVRSLRAGRASPPTETAAHNARTLCLMAVRREPAYRGGRLKVSASLLPQLAQILNLSLDELLGLPTRRTARRGPSSRLEQQIDVIRQMPMTRQKFVSEMLDNVIGKTE